MSVELSLFERFEEVFRKNSPPAARDADLLIESDDREKLKVYYSPFEFVVNKPKLVIVGITPGPDQATRANQRLWRELRAGRSIEDALRVAKFDGAFNEEPLRGNLLRQLSHWHVPEFLELRTAAEIFSVGQDAGLVQLTSSLRFPTFKADKPYAGHDPRVLDNALLKRVWSNYFVKEAATWRDAIVIPLGSEVPRALGTLVASGKISGGNIYPGLFHPSGQNTYRIDWILSDRATPEPWRTNSTAYDAGRRRFERELL